MRTPTLSLALALLAACLLAPTPTVLAEEGRTVIVVDASGSMWGQVGGEAKIEIARRVFGDLLKDWPADRELGVIAYGHRRKGDCKDIERIVEIGPLDAATALERIQALKPQGRTPLTDAVEQAAEALRYKDAPATVVLLTDGLETCDRDPCQLAETLERAGVALTVHVVGFDIAAKDRPQIACIAERTGGRFLSADSAAELNDAMRTVTVEAPPEPVAATVTLVAVDAETGQELLETEWTLIGAEDESEAGSGVGSTLSLELAPGAYLAKASALGAEATQRIEVQAGRPARHRIALTLPKLGATLEAPAEVPAGSPFDVGWSGPDGEGDYITVVPKGAPADQYGNYSPTHKGNPLELRAPDALGEHEIRYVSEKTRRVLASRPVTLIPVAATLEAPEQATAGSEIQVVWSGPSNEGDYLAVVAKGAPEGSYLHYASTDRGSPAGLTMPDAMGAHEIRYVVGQSGRTLASRPVELTAVAATLEAPPQVTAGSEIQVGWTGPDNQGDYIAVVAKGAREGTYIHYASTDRGSPATLTMPDGLGAHEIRYVVGQSGRTLASRPVELTAVAATLEAPAQAPAGSEIQVGWTGPDNQGDYIAVVAKGAPKGTYIHYAGTARGSPATLTLPDAMGAHELRYVVGQSGRTLASRPIELTETVATLEAPGEAPAGSEVEVHWTGPKNPGDYIAVVEKGAPEGRYDRYKSTSAGSPAVLQVPDALGEHEIRYVSGQSKRTLASLPLVLTAVEASVSLDGPIVPGAKLDVHWAGPANKGDYIAISPAGAREGTQAAYASTQSGSPARLKVPEKTGDYEIRYVVGQSKRTLASLPVKVAAPEVSLSAPGSARASAVIEVGFTGPGRYEDMIEIVPAGAPAKTKATRSARASQGSPLKLSAPPSPGDYEIRYRFSDTGAVAASVPLTVE